jgi:hypothetical protein
VIFFVASLAIALVLIVLGAMRIVRHASSFGRHLEEFEDLPILAAARVTGARVGETQHRVSKIPQLRARSAAALTEIGVARKRLILIAQSVRLVVRRMFVAP